ncbi:MAG: hypothetical protein ACM3WT_05015 [Bacillota bacterium]
MIVLALMLLVLATGLVAVSLYRFDHRPANNVEVFTATHTVLVAILSPIGWGMALGLAGMHCKGPYVNPLSMGLAALAAAEAVRVDKASLHILARKPGCQSAMAVLSGPAIAQIGFGVFVMRYDLAWRSLSRRRGPGPPPASGSPPATPQAPRCGRLGSTCGFRPTNARTQR